MQNAWGKKNDHSGQLKAAFDNPDRYKMAFIFGPDESEIAYIIKSFIKYAGKEVEQIILTGDQLENDPALLSDEANAISLFGEKKIIRVDLKRDEAMLAITHYLEGPKGDHFILVQSGNLTKTNKLRKYLEKDISTLCLTIYNAKADDINRRLMDYARELGLIAHINIIKSISARVNMNIHLAQMELEKIALYQDVSPDDPQEIDEQAVINLAADISVDDSAPLINAALSGNVKAVIIELNNARAIKLEPVRLLRMMMFRVQQLTQIAQAMESGTSFDSAARGVFFGIKNILEQQTRIWSVERLWCCC